MDYHISWPLNLNFNHCQLGQLSSPDRLSHHLSRRSSYFGVKAIQPDLPDSSTSNPFLSHHETVIPSSLLSAQSDHPHLSFPSDSPTLHPSSKSMGLKKLRPSFLWRLWWKARHRKTNVTVSHPTHPPLLVNNVLPKRTDQSLSGLGIFPLWSKFRPKTHPHHQAHLSPRSLRQRKFTRASTPLNSQSPEEMKPKNWEEYHQAYASGRIDVNDPPVPPPNESPQQSPTPYDQRCYIAPLASDEPIRQLVINRLELFGPNGFDGSLRGQTDLETRIELVERLESEGRAPSSLESAWDSFLCHETETNQLRTPSISEPILEPNTLEQHPVFRKIVRECREMFGADAASISIMEKDRQVFLAESGLGGMREFVRDLTMCSHTVLSTRTGFAVLDALHDWRFQNAPAVRDYGVGFYAGVPLMAPNLDRSSNTDPCPIGTLCVTDFKPRTSFNLEERRRLVYMAEYARREIELWFLGKIAHKMEHLKLSYDRWIRESEWIESVNEFVSSSSTDLPVVAVSEFGRQPRLKSGVQEMGMDAPSPIDRLDTVRADSSALVDPPSPSSPSSKPSNTTAIPFDGLPQNYSTSTDNASVSIDPKIQKALDLATQRVGETLNLSVVYLAAIAPRDPTGDDSLASNSIHVLSANDRSLLPLVLDLDFHLGALQSPDGEVVYQSLLDVSEVEGERGDLASIRYQAPLPWASAILLRLGPQLGGDEAGGFVLVGATNEMRKVFGSEDVTYLKRFSNRLARYIVRSTL